jgi:serine protease AprX
MEVGMSIVWGIRWDRRTYASLCALITGLVATLALHGPAAPAQAASDTTVIVGGGQAAERAIVRSGGTVDQRLPSLHMLVARVPRDSVAQLGHAPGVASVVADAAVKLLGDDTAAGGASTTMDDVRAAISSPVDGAAGVDVALIDSGTVPVPALSNGDGLVNGPDFSADAADPQLHGLDAFGHGTHVAGIISGSDPAAGFAGIAPDSRVVSVKVAATDGSTTLGRLLAGIGWTIDHRSDDGLNIRVLNLSFGVRPEDAYTKDVLAYATEQAWKAGIVVVVSAGNSGATDAGLDSPAYDPHVIAVGADDLNGTADVSDDSVPAWSSRAKGSRGPDLIAPGQAIVSLRVPGSYLDVNHPGARISDTLFRGSGTSQAAGVVSGAVALLVAQRPDLTPHQVKSLLTATADPLPGTPKSAQGAGRIDVAAAIAAKAPKGKDKDKFATAPAEGDRGAQGGKKGDNPAVGSDGAKWNGSLWNGSLWNGSLWNGSLWSGSLWSGSLWSSYDPDAPST